MAKILVVDDSKMLRDMVVYALNEGGYSEIGQAEDGAQGLEEAGKEHYDLILTDINMPNIDGFEFTRFLRAMPAYATTPILVLTTEMADEMKLRGKEAGATGWIVKPFVPDELLEVIGILLDRK